MTDGTTGGGRRLRIGNVERNAATSDGRRLSTGIDLHEQIPLLHVLPLAQSDAIQRAKRIAGL